MTTFVELDVRPILRNGGEPFGEIMAAITSLQPGQGLKLLATFKPTPLFSVLGSKGFSHEAREIGGGDWEVFFRPAEKTPAQEQPVPAAPQDTSEWPEPVTHLDNRDLDPPEPMVRILAATEALKKGEVLSALLCREPIFLLPELAKRGHLWRGGFESDGKTYKILVRIGAADMAAA
ncbi:SirA-like protein OS=Afipia felis OX=1035 GN=BN961_00426 PE=4 SV=1 [Afipia felis]